MEFSQRQQAIAWISFAIMAVMVMLPPWLWGGGEGAFAALRVRAGHGWLWSPPTAPREWRLQPLLWWWQLHRQLLVVGVGMVVLLFLDEARERGRRAGGALRAS